MMRKLLITIVVAGVGVVGAGRAEAAKAAKKAAVKAESCELRPMRTPYIFGHRGSAGYRPEHTIASYDLAIEMGADFIEPDLVSTKDHVLIIRHENEIGGTTDVAMKFFDRKTTKTVDGQKITGWFTEDFTLAEIKTLRAKERLESRDHSFDGKFQVMTFKEIIDFAKLKSKEKGRVIGVIPEAKHSTYFKGIGLPIEDLMIKELTAAGWNKKGSPVVIQSFELQNLKEMRPKTPLTLMFLMDEVTAQPYDFVAAGDKRTFCDLMKPAELKAMREYVDAIGPWKDSIIPVDKNGHVGSPNTLVADAHAAGLLVYPYTFRGDQPFLAKDYDKDPSKEYLKFYELGVDGLFSDFSDQAFGARARFWKRNAGSETAASSDSEAKND